MKPEKDWRVHVYDIRLLAPAVPWRRVIATRNVLAHGYGDISLDVIWGLVSNGQLEELESELHALLGSQAN